MLTTLLNSVIVRWIIRRILELGPIAAGGISAWNAIPDRYQDMLLGVLQGNWSMVTLGAVVSFAGYAWSFISTVKPHATADGVQVPTSQMTPTKKAEVKEAVKTTIAAQKRKTVNPLEALGQLFKR